MQHLRMKVTRPAGVNAGAGMNRDPCASKGPRESEGILSGDPIYLRMSGPVLTLPTASKITSIAEGLIGGMITPRTRWI